MNRNIRSLQSQDTSVGLIWKWLVKEFIRILTTIQKLCHFDLSNFSYFWLLLTNGLTMSCSKDVWNVWVWTSLKYRSFTMFSNSSDGVNNVFSYCLENQLNFVWNTWVVSVAASGASNKITHLFEKKKHNNWAFPTFT